MRFPSQKSVVVGLVIEFSVMTFVPNPIKTDAEWFETTCVIGSGLG
jgi:hypothetical protein